MGKYSVRMVVVSQCLIILTTSISARRIMYQSQVNRNRYEYATHNYIMGVRSLHTKIWVNNAKTFFAAIPLSIVAVWAISAKQHSWSLSYFIISCLFLIINPVRCAVSRLLLLFITKVHMQTRGARG